MTVTARAQRRSDALSRPRIVAAAIGILDTGGVDALTFRALAHDLATGAGAIYHYVANKGELLAAAASDLLAEALDGPEQADESAPEVRVMMTRVYQVIVEHPWVGTQLAAGPGQPAVLEVFDRIGSALTDAGVPEESQFDAASVLVHFLLGIAGQYDAGTRLTIAPGGRADFLAGAIQDADTGAGMARPFLRRMGARLATHDDREQFEAGVDVILAGITATAGTPLASIPERAAR